MSLAEMAEKASQSFLGWLAITFAGGGATTKNRTALEMAQLVMTKRAMFLAGYGVLTQNKHRLEKLIEDAAGDLTALAAIDTSEGWTLG